MLGSDSAPHWQVRSQRIFHVLQLTLGPFLLLSVAPARGARRLTLGAGGRLPAVAARCARRASRASASADESIRPMSSGRNRATQRTLSSYTTHAESRKVQPRS